MQVIKQQLQRKDHDMLLKEIMAELASAVDRLGI